MKNDQEKSILKISSIEDEIKKRREDIVSQRRSFFREESLMKRRKEKTYHSFKSTADSKFNLDNQSISSLFELKNELSSKELSRKVKAAVEVRKILSIEKNPPIQDVISSNMLPILIELLQHSNSEDLQFEALGF